METNTSTKEALTQKCVYCGQELPEKPLTIQVKKSFFEVCSQPCKEASEIYLEKDKKRKLLLYIIILLTAIVVIITAVSNGSMLAANVMQIVVGLAFILLPYPIANFTTFQSCPVRTVVLITRLVGAFLAVLGVAVFVGALMG